MVVDSSGSANHDTGYVSRVSGVSLCMRWFCFKSLLRGSIILISPPPTCKAYPIATLLHDHCAIYAPPTDPSCVCHTPCNIGHGNIV